jgi:hypothetical protein
VKTTALILLLVVCLILSYIVAAFIGNFVQTTP